MQMRFLSLKFPLTQAQAYIILFTRRNAISATVHDFWALQSRYLVKPNKASRYDGVFLKETVPYKYSAKISSY